MLIIVEHVPANFLMRGTHEGKTTMKPYLVENELRFNFPLKTFRESRYHCWHRQQLHCIHSILFLTPSPQPTKLMRQRNEWYLAREHMRSGVP
mmetsp:Transcript_35582/g.75988  ORF Transcript_35582/g.75988 Transcript_35582/m.75988 type:complete len:93 (-) Transcript_35582:1631-1909(-)